MGIGGALEIGRTGLLASQAAIEVTGNNLANVATAGYHRQVINLTPSRSQQVQSGVFQGRGVQVLSIVRTVDQALESRVRSATSDQSGATARNDVLSQIQSLENELSGQDLSTQLSAFFNSWSQLANQPQDSSLRSLVVQQGQNVAQTLKDLSAGLSSARTQLDQTIDSDTSAANDLLNQVQDLNQKIATTENGANGASDLRDQRDAVLGQLSQYLEISTQELPSGAVNVYVGSLPVILNGQNRGLEVQRQTVNGQLQINVAIKADGSVLQPSSGKLSAEISTRKSDLNNAIDTVNSFAGQLIYQVNKVHSQGQGLAGFTSVTSDNAVADPTKALNDPAAGLAFIPSHGNFQITVTQVSTGQSVTSTVPVVLDGIDPAGQTTLTSLAASLNSVANIGASVTPDGRLNITSASSDFQISFSSDTSGALASLGINSFFAGKDATDIAVTDAVSSNPNLLAAAQNNQPGDNSNALALAGLRTASLSALGGSSLTDVWQRHVEDYASRTSQAAARVTSTGVVQANLSAQQQAVSGVNSDEEAINLMTYQRAYEASARFLTVVDDMTKTLLALI